MEFFCDSDWGGDKGDGISTSGNVMILAGGAAGWMSRKQTCVARSTMEAEYVSMSEATREIQWIIPFFKEMGVDDLIEVPIKIFADNASAIKLSLTV